MQLDAQVRSIGFSWLAEQVELRGDVLDWSLLSRGFDLDGRRVPLVSQQGIFKPAVCELPLSIRTTANSPYDDHFHEGRLAYSYRGTDPSHRDNVGLRRLMERRVPLMYFHAVVPTRYLAVAPVLIVGDEPERLRFWVHAERAGFELGGASLSNVMGGAVAADTESRREYATRLVNQRLHQRGFRERVLDAYRQQCAMCRLRHRDLLDAAHIVPDSAGGEPTVPNGLALCKIHHTAFDIGVVGVHPSELLVRVRPDVLRESDGPMLRHGLQDLDGTRLTLPKASTLRPARPHLEWKWRRFERAG